MSYSRYEKRRTIRNKDQSYSEHFKKRDVNEIFHYSTPKFGYLEPDKLYDITEDVYIWKANDRLYKLAFEFYGDSELWWVIAWYNKKPTEAHYSIGDIIYIPKPLELILKVMGT